MSQKFINCERDIPSSEALKIVLAELINLKLNWQYKCAGTTLKTYHCKLIDPANKWIFYGCGKGIGIQSKVSATFEALEHYYCYKLAIDRKHDALKFMSCAQAMSQASDLLLPNLLPDDMIIEESKHTTLPWVEFTPFENTRKFYYPLFLVEPRYLKFSDQFDEDKFNYQHLCALACDSGTSSGTSFIEAAIHGLNECIERDASSIFLAQAFLKQKPINLIDKLTLPDYLLNYVKLIETEFADELAIVDITSDIEVPTFCVAFTKQKMLIQAKGYGTSLSKNYALERALLEALQPLHLRNQNLIQVEKNIVQNLADYPHLQSAAIADLAKMIAQGNFILKSFQEIEDPIQKNLETSAQLLEIMGKIKKVGLVPHYMFLNAAENPITCLKIIVPGMDNFFLVSDGKLVLPSKRALSCIN